MKNDLVDNFCKLTKSFSLTNRELCDLARNSFIASYASDDQKQQYLKILDEWMLSEIGSK
jgi:adenosine deaminase